MIEIAAAITALLSAWASDKEGSTEVLQALTESDKEALLAAVLKAHGFADLEEAEALHGVREIPESIRASAEFEISMGEPPNVFFHWLEQNGCNEAKAPASVYYRMDLTYGPGQDPEAMFRETSTDVHSNTIFWCTDAGTGKLSLYRIPDAFRQYIDYV